MAAAGRRGANLALALASNPGRFLSAVQIGITLIGIVSGVYSGEAFGMQAADYLRQVGLPDSAAITLGYGAIVVIVTYFSVIFGELVPKNLALRNAEALACAVAPVMIVVARAAAPVVWLLDASTRLVFRAIGLSTERETR